MKCQKCDKVATFHITELTGGDPVALVELHLCEDHARQYLTQAEEPAADSEEQPSLAGALAQQLQVGQTAEELSRLDRKACPVCGITFYEFRSKGRLGCPHDYTCFAKELIPLIANIHGETEHVGKVPRRAPMQTEQRTKLIRLRRDMKEAVGSEDYERATELRDEIKRVEEALKAEAAAAGAPPATETAAKAAEPKPKAANRGEEPQEPQESQG
jgi:protein arginine kinase activator